MSHLVLGQCFWKDRAEGGGVSRPGEDSKPYNKVFPGTDVRDSREAPVTRGRVRSGSLKDFEIVVFFSFFFITNNRRKLPFKGRLSKMWGEMKVEYLATAETESRT